jgi:hypothetical protein
LDDLKQLVLNTARRDKKELPLFKLVVFGNKRSKPKKPGQKGALRNNENVLQISGIELDYDLEKIAFDDVLAVARELNIHALLYTSPSHTLQAPRWRIICPTSQLQRPDMRDKLLARLNGYLMQKFSVDAIASDESFTLSQSYYFGWIRLNNAPKPDHCAEVIEGISFIDQRDDLAIYEALGAKTDEPPSGGATGPSDDTDEHSYGGFENILNTMGDGPGLKRFHAPLRGAAMSYARTHHRTGEWDRKKLKERLREAIRKAPNNGTQSRLESIKHYLSDAYLDQIIQSAIDKIKADPIIAEFNEQYALVRIGGKVTVMVFENDTDFTLLDTGAFKQWYANRSIDIGGGKTFPVASYWLSHPQRRQYKGIGFWPDVSKAKRGWYNMWRGFGVRPIKGHCAKFLHHLKVNVCQRNKKYYRYLIAWLAQMVQHPEEKIGTSVVLRGPSGVGKTTVGVYVGSMFFVDNYAPVSSSERITGKFNAHLKTAILLVADEAFWAGDKAAEGRLKDLITSDRQFIEFKGKEVVPIGNYIRVLVFGNPDWLVPATLSERRWVVWDMGIEHKQNFEYFAASTTR